MSIHESEPDPVMITDTLDLHGFFPEQATEIILAFIDQAVEKNYYTVRIIHGKGKSRMKWEVYRILRDHPAIISFGDAPPDSGHWGATVVHVKTMSENKDQRSKTKSNL